MEEAMKPEFSKAIKSVMRSINYYAYRLSETYGLEYSVSDWSFDDCKQIIMIRLFKAYEKYSAKGGASPKTYLNACARYSAFSINRDIRRWKMRGLDEGTQKLFDKVYVSDGSSVEFIDTIAEESYSPEKAVIESSLNNGVEDLFDRISDSLKTDLHRDVFAKLRNGVSKDDIAAEHGFSSQRVSDIIRKYIRPAVVEHTGLNSAHAVYNSARGESSIAKPRRKNDRHNNAGNERGAFPIRVLQGGPRKKAREKISYN